MTVDDGDDNDDRNDVEMTVICFNLSSVLESARANVMNPAKFEPRTSQIQVVLLQ